MGPDRAGQYTLRKIVNRHIHTSGSQVINRFRQPLAIVHGIHPEHRIVRNGKTGVFESHQRDVIDERQISGDPPTCLRDNRRGQAALVVVDFLAGRSSTSAGLGSEGKYLAQPHDYFELVQMGEL